MDVERMRAKLAEASLGRSGAEIDEAIEFAKVLMKDHRLSAEDHVRLSAALFARPEPASRSSR